MENANLYVLKGVISDLSEEDQAKIKLCFDELSTVYNKHGEFAVFAFSLFALELQSKL